MKKLIMKGIIGGINMSTKPSKFNNGTYDVARVGIYIQNKDGSRTLASAFYNGNDAKAINANYKAGDKVDIEGVIDAVEKVTDGKVVTYYNIINNAKERKSPSIKHSIVKSSCVGK